MAAAHQVGDVDHILAVWDYAHGVGLEAPAQHRNVFLQGGALTTHGAVDLVKHLHENVPDLVVKAHAVKIAPLPQRFAQTVNGFRSFDIL